MSRKRKQNRGRAAKGRTASQGTPDAANLLQRLLELADEQPNPQDALEMYRMAWEHCRHVEPVSVSDSSGGGLWDLLEGRCYLRAAFGVAASLWRLNRFQEAAEYFHRVLQTDPADHLFARYWLAACLLNTGQLEQLRPLLNRFDERTAIWRYIQALSAFVLHGDCDESCRLLTEARQLDDRVVDYLLGDSDVRADQPIRFEPGCNATHSTARLLLLAWRSVPGAVTWVRRLLRAPTRSGAPALPFPREQLLALPRQGGSWQVGLMKLDEEESGEQPCWALGVADVDGQQLRYMTVVEGNLSPDLLWSHILAALLQPLDGTPQRPRRLELPRPEYRRAWRKRLGELGIECRVNYRPQPVTQLLEGFARLAAAERLPQLGDDFDPRDLPQGDDAWQIDFFHQPRRVTDEQFGIGRPWSVLVLDKQSHGVLGQEVIPGEPDASWLWQCLLRVMQKVSQRPRRIEVSDSDGYEFLRPRLAEADVQCVLLDELPELHAFCRELAASYGGPEICALAEGENLRHDQMESFYYAACHYFQRAPWNYVPGEIPIEVEVGDLGIRYAIVLGRTGVTFGLVVLKTWQDAANLISGRTNWQNISGWTVVFDEETVMAPLDLYLVERHGWPIATPEAYPATMRLRPGYEPCPPAADELEYLIACLYGLPDFLTDQTPSKIDPPTAGGQQREIRFIWAPRPPLPRADRQRPAASKKVASGTALRHVNRKGQTYYLHEGRTQTGKPKYFFSTKSEGELCARLPEGFEIYESPRGQVLCRRIRPKRIMDQEVEVVREALRKCDKLFGIQVDTKGDDIIIYEREVACLKFTLCDEDRRHFYASRWFHRGSTDYWLPLLGGWGKPLPELAARYCRYIGEESFYELM